MKQAGQGLECKSLCRSEMDDLPSEIGGRVLVVAIPYPLAAWEHSHVLSDRMVVVRE